MSNVRIGNGNRIRHVGKRGSPASEILCAVFGARFGEFFDSFFFALPTRCTPSRTSTWRGWLTACVIACSLQWSVSGQTIERPTRRAIAVSSDEVKIPAARGRLPAKLRTEAESSVASEAEAKHQDREVRPAGYAPDVSQGESRMPLAPRSPNARNVPRPAASGTSRMLATMISSLAVVLGLFMLLVWLVRRSLPRSSASVPKEVVEVFGRATITPRQSVHVVRFGSKMLLLSITPGGMEALSEITDRAEVDRLAGLCQESQPGSVSRSFRQLITQMGNEPTNRGFIDEAPESGRGPHASTNRSVPGVRHA